jgi:Lon protease-like protein
MSDADPATGSAPSLEAVPLFPLPNVVLFPRAVLPLHIFEERYKTMTANALAGERQVAMALLRPGWEKSYYGRPDVEPVVCVGTIVSHEKLPDGKYNFLLQGHTRARIVREHPPGDRPYRLADLRALEEVPAMEIDLEQQRRRMIAILNDGALSRTSLARQFRRVLDSSIPTSHVADLLAFNMLDDVMLKQSLLADIDVRDRVERTVQELHSLQRLLGPALRPDEASLN